MSALPLTAEQEAWLKKQGGSVLCSMKGTPTEPNPCRIKFGPGPADKRCKDCAQFIRKRYSKTYFKCALRGDTNGPGTDHRANWLACSKWEAAK